MLLLCGLWVAMLLHQADKQVFQLGCQRLPVTSWSLAPGFNRLLQPLGIMAAQVQRIAKTRNQWNIWMAMEGGEQISGLATHLPGR